MQPKPKTGERPALRLLQLLALALLLLEQRPPMAAVLLAAGLAGLRDAAFLLVVEGLPLPFVVGGKVAGLLRLGGAALLLDQGKAAALALNGEVDDLRLFPQLLALAVALLPRPILVAGGGRLALALDGGGGGAEMLSRLPVDPLPLVAAVIDALGQARAFKGVVDLRGGGFPDGLDLLRPPVPPGRPARGFSRSGPRGRRGGS